LLPFVDGVDGAYAARMKKSSTRISRVKFGVPPNFDAGLRPIF
jgi:hypothetical protein